MSSYHNNTTSKRNNSKYSRNKKRNFKNPVSKDIIFNMKVKEMFYKPFTFVEYLKSYGSDPKLYATLFLNKLKAGFQPSASVINYVLKTKGPEMNAVRNHLLDNRYLEQMHERVSGYF